MSSSQVSVIINNYNYACFLRDAIDSALAQTYSHVEVIVVDDGSTDDSREVIAGYGSRIVPVLKSNGGQASAFNAGFARSRGEIILLLDADDMLLPTTAERVVAALAAQPDAAKIQYHLEVTDASGTPTGELFPSFSLSSGDLRRRVLEQYTYRWPPTSGNAFPRRVFDHLLPMPEQPYLNSADRYLADLAPLLGPVVTLPDPGARYRKHGANYTSLELGPLLERLAVRARSHVQQIREGRAHQRRLARELGLPFPSPERDMWMADVFYRLISLKLDPPNHPVAGDTLSDVVRSGLVLILTRARSPMHWGWRERLARAGWLLAVAAAPRRVAVWLIKQHHLPKQRGSLIRRVAGLAYRTEARRQAQVKAMPHT